MASKSYGSRTYKQNNWFRRNIIYSTIYLYKRSFFISFFKFYEWFIFNIIWNINSYLCSTIIYGTLRF